LRFSPTAWAKLLFLRDAGDTEIGGFGIAGAGDLLFVQDIRLVRQTCTWVHVEFDDESVANFFEDQVDAGRRPEQFARIWIHTHPGSSPEPSGTDEATFSRVFGNSHWALMFILARGGQSYARLRFNVGPGGEFLIPVEVDYSCSFAGSAMKVWQEEYSASVQLPPPESAEAGKGTAAHDADDFVDHGWRDAWGEYADFDHIRKEDPIGYIRDF
jgi:proteasome lid subunit RPN8/RPN11